jgi:hypothetical protein
VHVFVAFSAPPTRVSPPRLERAYAVTMRFDHFHPEIESTLTFCLSGEPPKALLSPACDPAHNACRSAHSRGRDSSQRCALFAVFSQHCAISPNRLADLYCCTMATALNLEAWIREQYEKVGVLNGNFIGKNAFKKKLFPHYPSRTEEIRKLVNK